jgi:hypothetical protein
MVETRDIQYELLITHSTVQHWGLENDASMPIFILFGMFATKIMNIMYHVHMSVCLPVFNNSRTTKWIFMKFDIVEFL